MAEAIAVPAGAGIPGIPAGASMATPPGQAAPAPQPAPAPVAPPAPAPVPAPQPAPAPAAPVQTFALPNDGGEDPALKAMTNAFLSMGSGIDLERAIGKALQFGNPALIDTAYITEKGGSQSGVLNELGKQIVEQVQRSAAAATSAAHSAAGSKEAWDAAAVGFNANAPQHLKTVVRTMLESGDSATVAAAAKTVVDFVRQGGIVATPAGLVQHGTATGAANALDKAGFQAELRKLNARSSTFEADRAALFARRSAGRASGI